MATKNLKVLMSGDTKPYRAEMDQAAVSTKVMKDEIGGQMNDLAGLFGTSIGTIGKSAEKISTVFQGLLASLTTAAAGGTAFTVAQAEVAAASTAVAQAEARVVVANEALTAAQASATISAEALLAAELEVAAAAKAMATSQASLAVAQKAVAVATDIGTVAMNIFKIAMISTGIGALVVALGSVVAYFSSTREGANKLKVIMAEVGAVVKVLIDRFSSFGEGVVKFLTGDFAGSAQAMKGVFSGIGTEMVEEAKAAGDLQKQTQALNKEERENKVLQQERLTRAAQLRNDAKQEGVDAADKKKMLAEAKSLIIEYYAEEKHIAEGRRDILVKEAALHKNMGDELNAVEDAKVKVLQTDQESAEAQKALSREMKAVNKEITAQTAAILKKAEEQRKIDVAEEKKLGGKMKAKTGDMSGKTQETIIREYKDVDAAKQKKITDDPMYLFNQNIEKSKKLMDGVYRDTWNNMDKTEKANIDLSKSLTSGLEDMSIGVGEFMGSLLSGKGGVQDFGTLIAGVFADMCINVGKMAIATGMAVFGIQAALKSLNPYVAIAAGIALVALGTAIKGRLSAVASGGGSGATSSGGQNLNYDTRSSTAATAQKISVVVSGKLTADAKGLTTTLSNENTRVAFST